MSNPKALVRAPEFPEGMQWLNTDKPLRLKALRGKIVLLDFWTYCCINCMHILPDLAYLEHKYRNELVVNDHQFQIWQHYTTRAWPTLIVIRPDGYVLGYLSGEGNREILVKVIDELIAESDRAGILTARHSISGRARGT